MNDKRFRVFCIILAFAIQNVTAKNSGDFGDREVKIATHLWGVDVSIPVKEFPNGTNNPTNIRWKIIDENSRVLTFNSYDPVSDKRSSYRVLFSKLDIGMRKYALIERIVISGYELSPYERSKFAELFFNANQKLVKKYSKWLDSLKQSEISNQARDQVIDISNAKIGSSSDSQADSIGAGVESTKISSANTACASSDSVLFDAQYSDQVTDEVMPVYPELELINGKRSVVEVLITLTTQGVVSSVDIIVSGGESFDKSVTRAVHSSRFKPFMKSGCAFQCKIKKKYNFEL